MDDQIEPTKPAPTHRRFKLTPLPGASGEPEEGLKSGLRRKLIIGGSAIPFVMTIYGRAAFANKKGCTVSIMLSHRNSAPLGGGGKKGTDGPCGMPSNGNGNGNWQTQYTTLFNDYNKGEMTYQQLLPAQVTSNNYLTNPTITTSFPFTIPGPSNGVSFSISHSNFTNALKGGAGGVVLTVTVTVGSGPGSSQTQNDGGKFFQQAITALLNASFYGSSSFGYTDAQLIQFVNSVFTTMQSQAGKLESQGQNAAAVIKAIFAPGGASAGPVLAAQSVTTDLANLNSQGTG